MYPRRARTICAAATIIAIAVGCGKSASHEAFVVEKCDEARTRLQQLSTVWAAEAPQLLEEYSVRTERLCDDLAASRSEEQARTIYREANPDAWAAELLGWLGDDTSDPQVRPQTSPMPRLGASSDG